MAWYDGENRTPSIGFTYNNNAEKPEKLTPARMKKWNATKQLMRRYHIKSDRLIVLEGSSLYSGENPDLVRMFMEYYEDTIDWPKITIFRDKSNAFLEDKEDIFNEFDVDNVLVYPPKVHELLSPNDNKLHGIAKAEWKNSGVDIANNIASTLCLMHCLDNVSKRSIHDMWIRNFCLEASRLTIVEARDFVSQGQRNIISNDETLHSCYEYISNYKPTPQKRKKTNKHTPKKLFSELDGVKYDINMLM